MGWGCEGMGGDVKGWEGDGRGWKGNGMGNVNGGCMYLGKCNYSNRRKLKQTCESNPVLATRREVHVLPQLPASRRPSGDRTHSASPRAVRRWGEATQHIPVMAFSSHSKGSD